jgi:CO/xanthine dehydrogenase Mo-binding subunit
VIGNPTRRLDAPEVDDAAKFGMDVHFPGLLTAVSARSPVFGGGIKSVDDSRALAVPGVRKVVRVPSGVAVVADNFWAARQGREALQVDWDLGPNAGLDTGALRKQFHELSRQDGARAVAVGDARAALAKASKTIEAEYVVPYLAHATMEPLNCTVRIGDGKCEVWAGTQFQSGDQELAAKITGLQPSQVDIHTMFLGGGFGRRAVANSDFVGDAVHVAKAAGAPVKTVWTREDDIRGGYYRPMFLHRARIGLGADGLPMAWDHTLVGQSILAGTAFEAFLVKDGIDGTSVEGTTDSPYLADIADRRVDLHSPRTGIPVLWWRSVGNSHTAFVMESLIDEAARGRRSRSRRLSARAAREAPASSRRAESRRGEVGLGPEIARRSRAWGRRARIVRQFRGAGRRSIDRVGRDPRAPRDLRGRLRRGREPRGRHRADGIGYRVRTERCAARRDRVHRRTRAAIEFPRLPGASVEPGAGDRGACLTEHREVGRRRRAGNAADRTRGRERDRDADGPEAS